MAFLEGFLSLGRKINKVSDDLRDEQQEGILGDFVPEISLNKKNDELITLKQGWEKKWNDSKIKKEIEGKQKENEKYWLGDHYTLAQRKTGIRQPINNLIFEALETFLPVVTRQVAQPLVDTVSLPDAKKFARKATDKIVDLADEMRLRLKIKKAIRYWALYYLGTLKIGWSLKEDEIVVEVVRPQLLILDPDAITDECEYIGDYLGHYRTDSAGDLIARFPSAEKSILKALGKDELGTKIRYIEWWTSEFVFWTLKDEVLGKAKNPHWNYDRENKREIFDETTGETSFVTDIVRGNNHFKNRKIPFAMLSVFSLGTGPYDATSLMEQVLPLQDIVNKRVRQIDKNADNTNAGSIVSGEFFTKEQAAQVGEALRRGNTIFVPRGDISRAYKRDVGAALPQFVYQNLLDSRDQIRGVFGVTGLSAQGIKSEETVRGKILVRGQDSDRASLVVDHIEQLYDYVFNWLIQMMVVYYDTPRPVTKSSSDTIQASDFIYPLIISVKEGSLIPKDRLTQRNEAIDLWGSGAIDPLTLAERLEEPDPKEFVRRLIAWKTDPISLIGEGQTGPPPQAQFPGEQSLGPEQMVESQILRQVPI